MTTAALDLALAERRFVTRIRWSLSDAAVMTHRYTLQLIRVPAILFFALLQPVMFVLLFRYVLGGAIPVSGATYAEFFIPGAIVQSTAFSSFGTAVGLNFDVGRGLVDRIRAMPTARFAVLAGRLASDTVRSLGMVIVLIGVGYAVGFRFENGAVAAIAMMVLAVVFGIPICCIAATIGLTMKDPEAVQSFGLIWLFPLTFISSAFVQVQSMPGWLQVVARANPVTLGVDSMRALAYGGPLEAHLLETIAWMIGILAVFGPLAIRAYRRTT
jgi:ABC-2 type transport system permease protein/oleandomycin transport system permease protein